MHVHLHNSRLLFAGMGDRHGYLWRTVSAYGMEVMFLLRLSCTDKGIFILMQSLN